MYIDEDVKMSSDITNTELFTLKYSKSHSKVADGERLSNYVHFLCQWKDLPPDTQVLKKTGLYLYTLKYT